MTMLSLITETAQKLARDILAPQAAQRDRECVFPREPLERMGEYGLMGMLIPESWGGAGSDHLALTAAIEEIAVADGVCAMIMASQNTLANRILLQFGSERQKMDCLIPLAQGKKLCGFALTEAQGGSDAFSLRTTAHRDGDHYILQGAKQFVTSGKNADYIITFARTSHTANSAHAFTAFLVPTHGPGYQVGKEENTMGMRASDTCQIYFNHMHLPLHYRIGEEGQGYHIATANLDRSRVAIAAQCLGLARAAYEIAAHYALERQVFGKPIMAHQAGAFRVADMATQLHAARLLVQDAAKKLDAGLACTKEASMAKLYSSEVAEKIAHDAMQLLGGYGYLNDFPIERIYRDARACTLYEGTSDIQRILISNEIIKELRG